MRYFHVFAILLSVFTGIGGITPHPAHAQEVTGVTGAQVLTGWRTERNTHMAAFHITLEQGWKTYWRAPGESGIPPRFDWSGSRNIKSVRFHWPRPQVYDTNGVRTIGFQGQLVLPVEITPRREGAPVRLQAEMQIGVCESICIPMTLNLRAELPATNPEGSGARGNQLIAQALASRPRTAVEAGAGNVRCTAEPISDGLTLTAEIPVARQGRTETVVFELPDQNIWISGTNTQREGPRLIASADFVPPSAAPFALQRSDLRITVIGANGAVDIQGCRG